MTTHQSLRSTESAKPVASLKTFPSWLRLWHLIPETVFQHAACLSNCLSERCQGVGFKVHLFCAFKVSASRLQGTRLCGYEPLLQIYRGLRKHKGLSGTTGWRSWYRLIASSASARVPFPCARSELRYQIVRIRRTMVSWTNFSSCLPLGALAESMSHSLHQWSHKKPCLRTQYLHLLSLLTFHCLVAGTTCGVWAKQRKLVLSKSNLFMAASSGWGNQCKTTLRGCDMMSLMAKAST